MTVTESRFQSEVVVPFLGVELDGFEDALVLLSDQSFEELAFRD